MRRLRLAFVIHRYGSEPRGSAEIQCRDFAGRMGRHHDVEILTISSGDEHNSQPVRIDGLPVRSFKADSTQAIRELYGVAEKVLKGPHSTQDEVSLLKAEGPYSSELLEYLAASRYAYDIFVFFCLSAITYFGLPAVAERAILVPTRHDELSSYLSIFDDVFCLARYVLYTSPEEETFLKRRFFTYDQHGEVVGMGIEPIGDLSPDQTWNELKNRIGGSPFVLYIGAIDPSEGCKVLVEYFRQFISETGQDLKLVMLGKPVPATPAHPAILYPGAVSSTTEYHAIAGCRFLAAPSAYDSLSVPILKAWQLQKPVLVNSSSSILRGQCVRSNAGLWYSNYPEFCEGVRMLLEDEQLAQSLGRQGASFVSMNYTWQDAERKLLRILQSLAAAESPAAPQNGRVSG